jgi:phosphatidylserine/phosphatidylglycerophosphate/cardiolipin synthase-like enzyme
MLRRLAFSFVIGLGLIVVIIAGIRPSLAASTSVLISAVYYDTYLPNEPDEAFRLTNVSAGSVNLTNWTVTDGEGVITLTGSLAPGANAWIASAAVSFTLEFGFSPAYEYGVDSDAAVPNLARSGSVALGNSGDELILKDGSGTIVDSMVWESGNATGTGWSGPSINPYDQGFFGLEGQVLYRKLSQATGQPVPDTDTAGDWAQATDDDINGKKVQYPGWDVERFFQTARFSQTATITILVAPDNIFLNVRQAISSATTSIRYEGYTFDNAELAETLMARAAAGVSVTVLLEGAPVGGVQDQDKWVCQQIENAGGQCWFMINDDTASPVIHDRYAYQHAKFLIVDDRWLLTGSENLNYSSMPSDNKADGTSGNRGIWLWTDASGPISHALDVFQHDFDPANHRDLKRWNAADPKYGAPPPTFTVSYASGGTSYPVQFPQPFVVSGNLTFEIVQSPDNSLRDSDALLGLVARAGSGDRVYVEQLYEYKFWGPTSSNPTVDPNPRLEAYIGAARRGSVVRLLLDSAFNDPGDPRGNTATCSYVNSIAASEGLDLECLLGNPTGTGIHNKMVLVRAGGQGWTHTGSINGSENSSKQNREMAVQVQSTQAFDDLAGVFCYDWEASGGACEHTVHLPLVLKTYPAWSGSVTLNSGLCCIGGTAGVPLDIPATFTAWSALGGVTQMRTSAQYGCASEAVIGQSPWEAFVSQKSFTFTPPINWTTYYLSVQYRDAPGNVSPIYCDDIAVEGMPPQADPRIVTLSGTSTPEYVTIQNFGAGSQDMTGWYLLSVVGPQTFYFPAGYTLAPGATVRIESYTGAAHNPPAVLLWSSAAIWNNSGDKAVLYNSSAVAVSSLCYGNACP